MALEQRLKRWTAAGLLDALRGCSALRPAYAAVFGALGWAELVLYASIGLHAFYANTRNEPWNVLWVGFAIALVMAAWLWQRLTPALGGKVARWLLVVALLLIYVPARVLPGHWDLLAALERKE